MLKLDARAAEALAQQAAQAPRTDRPWGAFFNLFAAEGFQVKVLQVTPGASLSLQYHHHRAEVWTIASGRAEVTVNETVVTLNPGDTVQIPKLATHRLRNPGDQTLHVVEVQFGDYLGEDDIVRLSDTYGRVSEAPR